MSLNEVICVNDDGGEMITVLAARSASQFAVGVSGNPEEFHFIVIPVLLSVDFVSNM